MSNYLKYFEKQLEACKPISKDVLSKLKGKSFYDRNWQEGDKLVCFMQYLDIDLNKKEIECKIEVISDSELDKFFNDFEYLGTRDGLTIPEFIKRTNKNYKIITKMFKEN
ncbi:MAG TPA: hypothetical protein PLI22_06830 [Caldisericia bacterium]|nr:hypothetical protein [Caldisericia bacterium]